MFSFGEPRTAGLAKACLACRSRHLKCSGGDPCTRCRSEGDVCTYVKSRRGYKGPRKNRHTTSSNSGSPPDQVPRQEMANSTQSQPQFGAMESSNLSPDANTPLTSPSTGFIGYTALGTVPGHTTGLDDLAFFETFNAFYNIFYLTHPFLLPRDRMLQLLKERSLPHLELAIQYLGSHYVSPSSSPKHRDALSSYLAQQTLPRDGFMVQALLLFSIGLHATNEVDSSRQSLDSAISLALELGMHQANFTRCNPGSNPVMEESWRRTWWELYIVDGLSASVTTTKSFGLWDLPCDVALPCEDTSFFLEVSTSSHSTWP